MVRRLDMKILFCTSEAAPFAKTGGLADVLGALPAALKKTGVDARVVMPYYKCVKEKFETEYVGYGYVDIAMRREYVGVYRAQANGVEFYFVDNERYFLRDGLYGHGDDGERFAYFDLAVPEVMKIANFFPDVVHVNDWQTGLIPYILHKNYCDDPRFANMRTVLSIHNIQYQGSFSTDMQAILPIPYTSALEHDGRINFLKTAIVECDYVTTVSPTYASETLTEQYGYGLQSELNMRKDRFCGILNGIDVEKYNPETDAHILPYPRRRFVTGKRANKKALLQRMGMPSSNAPLFGLVSRLADQKGFDILMPVMEELILTTNANFVFVGSGEGCYENFFRLLCRKYPDRFAIYVGYSDDLAQMVYAASDVFLMPSKFEPCGLGQMIAMRYGSLPLVRETGGLKDTVAPYNKFTHAGNGFSFYGYSAAELKEVARLAVDLYNDNQKDFRKLVRNAMKKAFSWETSAEKYKEIYTMILGGNV